MVRTISWSYLDHGVVRQNVSTTQLSGGSASSVALPGLGKTATQVLALPAPDGIIVNMERKQQLLVQEQQLWHQYERDGMQGKASLAKITASSGYYATITQPIMMPYRMPQVNGLGQPRGYL
ncbi:hypothetical protein CRYUN_Cryun03dG0071600 [Craigia yunnanensis]